MSYTLHLSFDENLYSQHILCLTKSICTHACVLESFSSVTEFQCCSMSLTSLKASEVHPLLTLRIFPIVENV